MTPTNEQVEELAEKLYYKFYTEFTWRESEDGCKKQCRNVAKELLQAGYRRPQPTDGLDKREIHKIVFEFLHHPDTYSDLDIKESTSSINCFHAISQLVSDEICAKFGQPQPGNSKE